MSKFPPTRIRPNSTEQSDAAELSQFLGEMWAHDTIKHCFFSTACVRMVQTLVAWRMDTKLFPISCLPPLQKEPPSSHVSVARIVPGAAWISLGVANQQWRKVISMFISSLTQLRCSQHSTEPLWGGLELSKEHLQLRRNLNQTVLCCWLSHGRVLQWRDLQRNNCYSVQQCHFAPLMCWWFQWVCFSLGKSAYNKQQIQTTTNKIIYTNFIYIIKITHRKIIYTLY